MKLFPRALWKYLHHLTQEQLMEGLHGPGCTGAQGVQRAVGQLHLSHTTESRCRCFAHAKENSSRALYCFFLRQRPFWSTCWWAVSLHMLPWKKSQIELILVKILYSFKCVGRLSLTLLRVKFNVPFLSALAVRTGSVGQLPSSSGAQDCLLLYEFSLISFLHSLSDNLSFILYLMWSIFLHKRSEGTWSCSFLSQSE